MQAISIKSLLLAATVAAGGLAGVALPTAAQAQAYQRADRHAAAPAALRGGARPAPRLGVGTGALRVGA